ncbi:MAG: ABC transporter permease [Lachnospiraceae bacterium]|nr:ABC transporter permease [Lachnospiraceae bacterium]
MKQIIKKVITTLVTLLIVSFLIFLAFDLIPGDPAQAKLGVDATPEQLRALRTEMGLDRPLQERYLSWLLNFCKGDFGTSYSYSMPVRDMILDKLPITFALTIEAFLLTMLLSIPLSIFIAKHEGGAIDNIFSAINQVIMAVPSFFSGILLTLLFGVCLKLFVPGDFVSYDVNFGAFLGYLFFPAFAIALPKAAMAVKMLTNSLKKEMKLDYTKTAYSRGNADSGVLYKHVLKNAFLPVVTFFGMTLADIFTGSIIVEKVFNIPGLGRILMTSISNRDYPVVEAIIMLMALVVVVVNLVVDLIYRKIDPRITVE